MRVYLVRHGEARPKEEDPERHLTAKGEREVRRVARFLRPMGLSVRAVWHSGKPRARQTAEILAGVVAARRGVVRRKGLDPEDSVGSVGKELKKAREELMVVAHLPFLSELVALLVNGEKGGGEVVDFPCAGVVCMERRGDGGKGGWSVAWMVVPDLLAR